MLATIVYVKVKPEHIQEFIEATEKNHNESVKESGNLRFDIIQNQSDPSSFVFYEAYKSEADSIAHKETEHYNVWKNTVEEWMAEPRKGVKHNILFPKI